MAASSGVFAESVGGPPDAGDGATGADEDEEGAGGGGLFGGLMGGKKKDSVKKTPEKKKPPVKKTPAKKTAAKASARKSKFTLEGAAVPSGDDVAWALIGFILVALLILI